MYLRKTWSRLLALACAGVLICGPARALADIYQLVDLGSVFDNEMYGLTSTGDVVVHYLYGNTVCAGGFPCFGLFAKDGTVSYSAIAPALSYDNGGQPCTSAPTWVDDPAEMNCNNGRMATTYAGYYQLWEGPAAGPMAQSDFTLVFNGTVNPILLNSSGDLAFQGSSGPGTGRNYVAYDLGPTPEPSSLVLLATGALGLAQVVRRRLTGNQN